VDEAYDPERMGGISGEDWRVKRLVINGPGQIGQIIREDVYTYTDIEDSDPDSIDSYYYHYDALGNVMNITDSDGDEIPGGHFQQDAFGNELNDSWNETFPRHITGKEYDQDMGMYYFGARWHAPVLGRMICASSLPRNIEHPYEYCESNPSNSVDPTGLFTLKCMADCIADNDPVRSAVGKALALLTGMPLPKAFLIGLLEYVGDAHKAAIIRATIKTGASRFTTMPSILANELQNVIGASTHRLLRQLGRYASHVVVVYGVYMAMVETACCGHCAGTCNYKPEIFSIIQYEYYWDAFLKWGERLPPIGMG